MSTEQISSDLEKEHLSLVREVLLGLEILRSSEEAKGEEVARKREDLPQKVLNRLKFIENEVTPILAGLDGDYEAFLRIPFDSGLEEAPAKVVVYDGIRVYVCPSPTDNGYDFARSERITEKNLWTFLKKGEGEAEALFAFGKTSKENIVSKIKKGVEKMESLSSSVPVLAENVPNHDNSLTTTIKSFFVGEGFKRK
jgi:hypothetical protein